MHNVPKMYTCFIEAVVTETIEVQGVPEIGEQKYLLAVREPVIQF